MPKNNFKVEQYYNQVAEDYHKIYESNNFSYKRGCGDYFRLQILVRLIAKTGAQKVYEVGVGDGSPLAAMHEMGLTVAGCDISSKMVEVACKRFRKMGVKKPNIIQADIENSLSFATQFAEEKYDAVMALGVMPHVKNDGLALDNIRALVKTGGKLYIEFRNSLFSLFTFNRYTHEFITKELLRGVSPVVVDQVSANLDKMLKMDLPPIRRHIDGKQGPGYDLIPAKFHNPLQLPELLSRSGFTNAKFHWYHFHAAPPWMADNLGEIFDSESMKMEHNTSDWRGFFLCSAVLVEADAV